MSMKLLIPTLALLSILKNVNSQVFYPVNAGSINTTSSQSDNLITTKLSNICTCDLIQGVCDSLCCCDQDCPQTEIDYYKNTLKLSCQDDLSNTNTFCYRKELIDTINERKGIVKVASSDPDFICIQGSSNNMNFQFQKWQGVNADQQIFINNSMRELVQSQNVTLKAAFSFNNPQNYVFGNPVLLTGGSAYSIPYSSLGTCSGAKDLSEAVLFGSDVSMTCSQILFLGSNCNVQFFENISYFSNLIQNQVSLLANKQSLSITVTAQEALSAAISENATSKACTLPTKIQLMIFMYPLESLSQNGEREYQIAEAKWTAAYNSRVVVSKTMEIGMSFEVRFINLNTDEVFDSVIRKPLAPKRLGQLLSPILE